MEGDLVTGEKLWERYRSYMGQMYDCEVDDWDSLPDADKESWNAVANDINSGELK